MGEGSTITKAELLNAMIRADREWRDGFRVGLGRSETQYDYLFWVLEQLLLGEEE